jgi:peptidyl-prolyl cis-trans isomerase A (cyclophilin A)
MPLTRAAALLLLVCTVSALACSRRDAPPREPQRETAAPPQPPAVPPPPAPDSFLVALTTSRGPLALVVRRSWAPQGADRFYALVHAGFYDGARFFRVVRGFVVQFGLPADPQLGRAWSSQVIPDDPVRQPNRRGTVAFASAGPNTRTTQLFINVADNLRLDGLGFAPIGQVAERLGVVDSLYAQYGERPSQDSIRLRGDAYLTRVYPKLDQIRTATIVREWR